jgi:mannose-1-phosphate guanylyltransferase/phosphomannomutase
MKIVILAGGKGTRLGLTDRPKAMVDVNGVPLLERLITGARDQGFTDFLLLTGVMGDVIADHFGDGSRFGVRIECLRETEALGTGGAVRDARDRLSEPFLIMYGDTLLDVDLNRLAAAHAQSGALGTLFVHPNDHPHDSDLLAADEDGRILQFLPKPHEAGARLPNLVSAALYVLDPAAIDFVPATGQSDWGRDIFPAIVDAGQPLHAYRSVEYIKDIGTPDRLKRGEGDLASGKVARLSARVAKPAIFLDRDGVLNREVNGVHRPELLELIDGVGEALRRVNKAGVPAICVTNQPDIAKGLMRVDDLRAVHAALDTALAADGAYLDDLFYCPHHPEKGWEGEVPELKIVCDCRKPAPGMLLRAADRHGLDLSRSWMIGDRYADIAAAHACGARAILLKTGHAGSDGKNYERQAEYICDTLAEAVDVVLKEIG